MGLAKRFLIALAVVAVFTALPTTVLAKPRPVGYVLVSHTKGALVTLNAKTGKLTFRAEKGHYGKFSVVVRHGKTEKTYHFTVKKPKPGQKLPTQPVVVPPSTPAGPTSPPIVIVPIPGPSGPSGPVGPPPTTPAPVIVIPEFNPPEAPGPANFPIVWSVFEQEQCWDATADINNIDGWATMVRPENLCKAMGDLGQYGPVASPGAVAAEVPAFTQLKLCDDWVTVAAYLAGGPAYINRWWLDGDGNCYAVMNDSATTPTYVLGFNEFFGEAAKLIPDFVASEAAIYPYSLPWTS